MGNITQENQGKMGIHIRKPSRKPRHVIRNLRKRDRRKCSVLKRFPLGIKKPLKQGKVHFS
jgi:hypothetical protein